MMITDNDDLLTEIFLWLPAKSLIRFKLVCKRWFSLVSSHYFSHLHTLHHHRRRPKAKPTLLLRLAETPNYFYLDCSKKNLVPFHLSPSLIEPTICSFTNGMFLLQCPNLKNPMEDCHIYNPTTKQSRKISLNTNEIYRCVMGLNLAFDPLKSPHYKIICIRATRRRSSSLWRSWWRRCQIEVYESENSTWKVCGEPFLALPDVNFDHGIYWKDGIHWRGIFFDLRNSSVETHPRIEFPGDIRTFDFYDNYIESNGYLHYIAHFLEEKSVMVFELQSDYSEWSLKYRVNLDCIASGPVSVVSIIRRESEEDSMLVVHEPGRVMAYDFQEKSVEEVIDFRDEVFYQEGCSQSVPGCSYQFIETLAPV